MLRQILIFVAVLIGINVILALFNVDFRISILGSLVASAVVTLIMNAIQRR